MKKQIPSLWGILIIVVFSSLIILYLTGLMASLSPETTLPVTEEETTEKETTQEKGGEEAVIQLPETIEIPQEILEEIEEKGGVIKITADGFEPKEITLSQGETISWLNYDTQSHQLTSNSIFNVDEIKPGDVWTFPGDEKGVFDYQIVGYPEQGKIIVE